MSKAPTPASEPTSLQRHGGDTLSTQLAARFAQRIEQGLLAAGSRLPSVRDCAARHGVSASTVVAAYDQLQAQGLVEARRQRGFFVRERRGGLAAPGRRLAAHHASLPPPVDATALIRGMLSGSGSQAASQGPGHGTLPPAWLDTDLLQRALRKAMATQAGTHFGDPAGDPGLRDALTRRLGDLGIDSTTATIVTTAGATHALDLVARTLLNPGDVVLVDDPGWTVEHARLSRLGMRLLPVPRGPLGPDLALLARLAALHQPKAYVTVSVLHNPTGCNLSMAAAHQVLQIAEQHDFHLIEDDSYAWFAPTHAPRLSALDGLRRTVYISGFSKILAPGWRVGFVATSTALAERLIDSKLLTSLTTPALTEHAVAWCLNQGLLRRHAERIQDQLDGARTRTLALARQSGCSFVTEPQGLFGWVETGVDTDRLAQDMLDQGWLLAPGSLFHAQRQVSTRMRINFASSQDASFWRALQTALKRLR